MNMQNQGIEISVYCLAYNCVDFIEKSIQGMLNQAFDLKYEIIIHDDASNDGTSDIIRNYAKLYPQKIVAIIQTENQYSKGVNIIREYIYPKIRGKYIAVCEGDDYWIDKNKLQMQYEYMEQHPNCSLCTHNTQKYDILTKKISKFNAWKTEHILTAEDVFIGWSVHTSSFFWRKDYIEWTGNSYWCGDYMLLTWLFNQGTIVALPNVMSQYNSKNPNGVSYINNHSNIAERKLIYGELEKYLNEYNELTQYKYDKYIKKRIELVKFQCFRIGCDETIMYSNSRKESISVVKNVISHESYSAYVSEKKGIQRLIRKFRYEGYVFYPLWKLIMKKYFEYENRK